MQKLSLLSLSFVGLLCASILGISSLWAAEEDPKKKEKDELHTRILPLPLIVIPVIQDNTVKRYYGVQMRLEVNNPEDSLKIIKKLPRLVDKIFTDFYKLFALLSITKSELHPEGLRKKVSQECARVLGDGAISAVIIDNYTRHTIEYSDT